MALEESSTVQIAALSFLVMRTLALAAALPGAQACPKWEFVRALNVPPQPENTTIPYAHGLEVDSLDRIYLTYWDMDTKRRACLVRWDPPYLQAAEIVGQGKSMPMCQNGTGATGPTDSVHGIRLVWERDASGTPQEYLYHANNNQGLFKTDLEGNVVWEKYGHPDDPTDHLISCENGRHCPTWFDKQPDSSYVYMADGYGSSKIYVYNTAGEYQKFVFDGTEDGGKRFNTPHAISWDPRFQQMVVSDRTNKRLVYYEVDKMNPQTFERKDILPIEGRPCNVRFWPQWVGVDTEYAVVPTLEGLVYVFDKDNKVADVINVTRDMNLRAGLDDPHDATFTLHGDIVVGTYNRGHVGYWRKLGCDSDVVV